MDKALPSSSDNWAFFLDVDGTLLDIAPAPDAVVVPADLPGILEALCRQVGGALAILTGRSVETIDRLFDPAHLPVGAVHGAVLRFADGRKVAPQVPAALKEIRERLTNFVSRHPGTLFEDKETAVALHFRGAPAAAEAAEAEVRAAIATAGDELVLQPGKMVFEIRPGQASKGKALAAFMADPAFAARRPLAVGDDLTDESMFAEARRLGGCALRVGAAEGSVARPVFDKPAEVRGWLASLISS